MRLHRSLRSLLAVLLLAGLFAGALSLAGGARMERADFTFNNGAEATTLDPALVLGILEGRVIRTLYEGLVIKDPATLAPEPAVAASWDIMDGGLRYRFHLRPDARWTNGDPVTAHDFAFSYERLLDPRTASNYANQLWSVRGARAFSSEVDDAGAPIHPFSSVGLRALDALTLEFELEAPTPYFLDILAFYALCPVNPRAVSSAKERWGAAWELHWLRPEHIVTNGPFRLVDRRINDRIRVAKFAAYWDADHVAFETIDILSLEQESTMLNLYLTGGVDYLDRISTHVAPQMLAREDFQPAPYAGTYFYRVNVTRPPFDDPRIRRALFLAVPREQICRDVMKMGQVPAYGLVPPGLTGYTGARTRAGDLDEAKRLLAEAGFGPGGNELPLIELHYNTSESHAAIAQVIALAWQNDLGLRAKLRNEEWKVYLDTQNSLRYDVSRSSWLADYADPNTFLEQYVTGGANNRTGWSHEGYDALVRAAVLEQDPARRFELLGRAEAILMDELPILPIYHYVTQNAVAPRLGGFHPNFLDDHFAKHLYWMDDEELEQRRSSQDPELLQVDPHGPSEGLYAPAHPKHRARPRAAGGTR